VERIGFREGGRRRDSRNNGESRVEPEDTRSTTEKLEVLNAVATLGIATRAEKEESISILRHLKSEFQNTTVSVASGSRLSKVN
jgi:hypothetical protein